MIRLAYNNPFPPFASDNRGRAEGVIIDILSAALAKVHLETVFVPVVMQEIQKMLTDGAVDGIAFYGVNPERARLFDFSDPIIVTGAALFVKTTYPPGFELEEDEGRKVVTPKAGPLADYIRENFPKVNLLLVQDYAEALKAVLDEEAEAAALNLHAGTCLFHQLFPGRFRLPKKVFLEVSLGVAVLKGHQPSLLNLLNDGLRQIKQDGTHAEIIHKWFDPYQSQLEFQSVWGRFADSC